MGIGAYQPWIRSHCTPEQAVAMADMAGARFIMPVHHQTFKLSFEPFREPIERFTSALRANRRGSLCETSAKLFSSGRRLPVEKRPVRRRVPSPMVVRVFSFPESFSSSPPPRNGKIEDELANGQFGQHYLRRSTLPTGTLSSGQPAASCQWHSSCFMVIMAKFLNTSAANYYLEEIIRLAHDRLVLISPFLKFNDHMKELLQEKTG